MKALALLSGGLDSILAIRVVLEQGIEVAAVNFVSPFCTCTRSDSSCSAAAAAAAQLGVELLRPPVTREYLELIKRPAHGYGSQMNPCLDCRIFYLRKAGGLLAEQGARFLVTGEVLGERPMSQQRRGLDLVERESGFAGLILRPLSARLLPETVPEREGWVDRERLLAIAGRCRRPQISLAAAFGIHDYPCPAGGCLLTDPAFARRLRELMDHDPGFTLNDANLLKVGRHFRLSPRAKAVVGRDEADNRKLAALARPGDRLLEAKGVTGPLTLLRGEPAAGDRETAAALTARYGKGRGQAGLAVLVRRVEEAKGEAPAETIAAPARSPAELDRLRIGG